MGPDGPLRVAFLVYRGNPHSGGQGVYTRYLTRELVALGHEVEVFSGPPYPVLDEGVRLTRVTVRSTRDEGEVVATWPSPGSETADGVVVLVVSGGSKGNPSKSG